MCKNNLNFVKAVPLIYVNLILSVFVVSGIKIMRPSYQPGSVLQIFKNLLVLSVVVDLCVLTLFFSVS